MTQNINFFDLIHQSPVQKRYQLLTKINTFAKTANEVHTLLAAINTLQLLKLKFDAIDYDTILYYLNQNTMRTDENGEKKPFTKEDLFTKDVLTQLLSLKNSDDTENYAIAGVMRDEIIKAQAFLENILFTKQFTIFSPSSNPVEILGNPTYLTNINKYFHTILQTIDIKQDLSLKLDPSLCEIDNIITTRLQDIVFTNTTLCKPQELHGGLIDVLTKNDGQIDDIFKAYFAELIAFNKLECYRNTSKASDLFKDCIINLKDERELQACDIYNTALQSSTELCTSIFDMQTHLDYQIHELLENSTCINDCHN